MNQEIPDREYHTPTFAQARTYAWSAFGKKLVTAQRRDINLKEIARDEAAHKAEQKHRERARSF